MRIFLQLIAMSLAVLGMAAMSASDQSASALVAQADTVQGTDRKTAVELLNQALPGLKKPEDAALYRQALHMLCINTAVSDANAALPMAEQGLKLSRVAQDLKSEAIFLRCQGYANEQLGNMSVAAAAYEQGAAVAEKAGDKEVLSDALATRGESRYYNGRYDEALADLKQSYDLSVALNLKKSQSYLLTAIANLYADANVGEYDQAIDYYQQALKVHEAQNRKFDIATAHFNIGSTLERKGDFDAALKEYKKAYEIDRTLNDPSSSADEERVIGAVLAKQGKPSDGLPWIEKAFTYYRGAKDADGVARTQLTRGIALRKLGRITEALKDIDASRDYFESEKNLRFLAKIHEERALAFAAAGDWRNAYEAGNVFRATQQQLDKGLLEERTTRLRVQFDTERKEQENRVLLIESSHRGEALRNANKLNRLQWLVIALGAALLALLVVLAVRQLYKTRHMRILAMTDELTKLPNRRHILTFLGDQAKTAYENEQPISIIVFDIDHFKQVNDKYGHDGGDAALKAVANIANQALRRGDKVGRIGGEEFLVVLPGTEHRSALEIAERLRRSVEVTEFDRLLGDLRMTISLGVSEWKAGHESIDALVKRADLALYEAKNSGRNKVVEK